MNQELEVIIRDIKSLKIQGARNVAKAAINAFSSSIKSSTAKSIDSFYKELLDTAKLLATCRPTEPMMRNSIDDACRFALMQIRSKKSIVEIKEAIVNHEEELLKQMEEDAKKLAGFGAELIPNNSLILTHCHSSTSTKVLIEAKKIGKQFSVVCFETRPRFQGRTTAKELLDAGIDVTLSVDGAMNLFMKKADMVIVGADSITSRGDLINKIGTSTLGHIARAHDVSMYSAAELFKYSPMTLLGTREQIEERDPKEVWDLAPVGLKIRNPSFEVTASRYLNGFITEVGIIPPDALFSIASQKLGIEIFG